MQNFKVTELDSKIKITVGSDGKSSNSVTCNLTADELRSGILTEENASKVYIVPSKLHQKQLDRIKQKLNKRSGKL